MHVHGNFVKHIIRETNILQKENRIAPKMIPLAYINAYGIFLNEFL